MIPNRFAFVALAMACLVAAAGGGYLAVRQNAIPTPATAGAPDPVPMPVQPAAPSGPVAEAPPPQKAPDVPVVRPAASPSAVSPTRRPAARPSAPTRAAASVPTQPDLSPAAERAALAPGPQAPPSPAATPTIAPDPGVPQLEERPSAEPPRVAETPRRVLEELVVSANSVIGLQTENRVTSETARLEDRVEGRVTRDVKVGDNVAIPAGSRAVGTVTLVERGGKFKERARLGIRFDTLIVPDGTRIPIRTETIYRDGEAPGKSSAAKMGGGAVGGASLGAILGGAKGAAIGATAGAGGGAVAVAASDRSAAILPAGTAMTVRILSPVVVTVEK
jgi:type IV secretory pathway VirB10-like protein